MEKELDEALGINEEQLANEVKAIGFKCRKCAQCCREEHGDNTVSIFPSEIRRICQKTGFCMEDFAVPAPSQDRDSEGNIHTFEWVLRKNGDCVFLEDGVCRIYECRPRICKTYPFYLLEGKLRFSECMGLGGTMSDEESREMASLLRERYMVEIRETISLLEKFRGFNPGKGTICVHDSEGEHWDYNYKP